MYHLSLSLRRGRRRALIIRASGRDNRTQWHRLFKPHPWHGVSLGSEAPESVTCYVEIVPFDTVKYEVDKTSGYLRLDRPQRYSNVCPTPYGFLPQTLCGDRVAARSCARLGRTGLPGDGDPLDVCVFTERDLAHRDILLTAVPIGGLRMVDAGEVDDKIVAVLREDGAFGSWRDISDCPGPLVARLKHYFLTYKSEPESEPPGDTLIAEVYGREEAHNMILLSRQDYRDKFPDFDAPSKADGDE